jgi:hypothetical protein
MHDGRDFDVRSASLAEVEQIGFGAAVLVSVMWQTKPASQNCSEGQLLALVVSAITGANDESLIHVQFEGGSGHATNPLSAVRTCAGWMSL